MHGANACSLACGLLAPVATHHIVRRGTRAQEVVGEHGELAARATLQQENFVVIAKTQEGVEIGNGLGLERAVGFSAVRHLKDRATQPLPVAKVFPKRFEYFGWHHRGTGTKIVNAGFHGYLLYHVLWLKGDYAMISTHASARKAFL